MAKDKETKADKKKEKFIPFAEKKEATKMPKKKC